MTDSEEREARKRFIRESGVWLPDRIAWLDHDDDDDRVGRFYHRTQHMIRVRNEMREFELQQTSLKRDARMTTLIHVGFFIVLVALVAFAVVRF